MQGVHARRITLASIQNAEGRQDALSHVGHGCKQHFDKMEINQYEKGIQRQRYKKDIASCDSMLPPIASNPSTLQSRRSIHRNQANKLQLPNQPPTCNSSSPSSLWPPPPSPCQLPPKLSMPLASTSTTASKFSSRFLPAAPTQTLPVCEFRKSRVCQCPKLIMDRVRFALGRHHWFLRRGCHRVWCQPCRRLVVHWFCRKHCCQLR